MFNLKASIKKYDNAMKQIKTRKGPVYDKWRKNLLGAVSKK